MRLAGALLLILFSLSFVCAIDASIDCPDSVAVGEEFSCSVEASGLDGVYDLKVEVMSVDKTVARIWNPAKGSWGSAYYYLKEFIGDSERKDVRLIVEASGDYDGVLKLRRGDTREFFEFDISVGGGSPEGPDVEDDNPRVSAAPITNTAKPIALTPLKQETISLNSPEDENEEVVIYKSKDRKILDYAPYAFSVFLIFVLAVVFWRG